jgi:carbamate kinase
MRLNQNDAYYILTNLNLYVENFENETNKKITPAAMQLIQEILTEASFPRSYGSYLIH